MQQRIRIGDTSRRILGSEPALEVASGELRRCQNSISDGFEASPQILDRQLEAVIRMPSVSKSPCALMLESEFAARLGHDGVPVPKVSQRGVRMNTLPEASWTATNATASPSRGQIVRLQLATRIGIEPMIPLMRQVGTAVA